MKMKRKRERKKELVDQVFFFRKHTIIGIANKNRYTNERKKQRDNNNNNSINNKTHKCVFMK